MGETLGRVRERIGHAEETEEAMVSGEVEAHLDQNNATVTPQIIF